MLRTKQRSWRRTSAIGALTYTRSGKARILLRFVRKEVRTQHVIQFLRHLLRHIKGRVVVLWDGLAAHWAGLVRDFVASQSRIKLVRLPAYAPELNPVEGLWAWSKGTLLANVCEEGLEPLKRRVRRGIRVARRRSALLWGFLDKAGLSL